MFVRETKSLLIALGAKTVAIMPCTVRIMEDHRYRKRLYFCGGFISAILRVRYGIAEIKPADYFPVDIFPAEY